MMPGTKKAPEDSLKKRYFFKLSANLFGLVISLFTQAIIPRGLGPRVYGDYNFLTAFFTEVASFFDMGTSTAFYTKLSQRPRETALVQFYLYFAGIVSVGLIGIVTLSSFSSFSAKLWPEQEAQYICMAAVWCAAMWVVQVINKMIDAYGLTVAGERARIFQRALGLVLIFSLYYLNRLDLTNFFYYNYFILAVLGVAFIRAMTRSGYFIKMGQKLAGIQIRAYLREFYQYSHPLFIYALIGLVAAIVDRWLLQYFGGSIQQGFFGLSYQIGALCFLFTSAMTPLLMREFSVAYGKKDLQQMALLFRRYIPLLYSIAAYFSCFIAVQAARVVHIFGGSRFDGAMAAVAIMAFYPIHQTYGQLSSSVFYATGQTALYRNIGIIFMIAGLPITYFLIAPSGKMGLNTGATGLAAKMVFLQFIIVNVQLYFNAKLLKLSFVKYFGHQIVSVACLSGIACISALGTNVIFGYNGNVVLNFVLAGFLYSLMTFCVVYRVPSVFGLKKGDIEWAKELLGAKIKEFSSVTGKNNS